MLELMNATYMADREATRESMLELVK